jgi:hypothetical protein
MICLCRLRAFVSGSDSIRLGSCLLLLAHWRWRLSVLLLLPCFAGREGQALSRTVDGRMGGWVGTHDWCCGVFMSDRYMVQGYLYSIAKRFWISIDPAIEAV